MTDDADPARAPGAARGSRACSASRRRRRPWPASRAAAAAGEVDPDALVVCVLTGNGLKDPTTAEAGLTIDVVEAEPSVPSVMRALGLVVSAVAVQ